MNPLVKVSTIILATGGTATAGGYSGHLSQLSTLSSLIEADEEVTQLTNDSTDGDGNEAWKIYKTSSNAGKLQDYNSVDAPKSFKDTCLDEGNKKVKGTNNDEFQNFKKGCSRNFTVAEGLKKSNLTLLDSKSEDQKGNEAGVRYQSEPINKVTNLQSPAEKDIGEVIDWATNKTKNTVSDGFKKKCEEKANIKIKNRRDELYKQVSSWCV